MHPGSTQEVPQMDEPRKPRAWRPSRTPLPRRRRAPSESPRRGKARSIAPASHLAGPTAASGCAAACGVSVVCRGPRYSRPRPPPRARPSGTDTAQLAPLADRPASEGNEGVRTGGAGENASRACNKGGVPRWVHGSGIPYSARGELAPEIQVAVLVADEFPNYGICGLPFFLSLSVEAPDWRQVARRTAIVRAGLPRPSAP
jgi:hypothetical protein